jgi:hypothetical protein
VYGRSRASDEPSGGSRPVVDDRVVLSCGAGRPPPALRSTPAATPGSVGVVARRDCGREPGPVLERRACRAWTSSETTQPPPGLTGGQDPIDPHAWRRPLAEAAEIHSPAVQGARLRPRRGACFPCRGRACLRSLPRSRAAVLGATARGCPCPTAGPGDLLESVRTGRRHRDTLLPCRISRSSPRRISRSPLGQTAKCSPPPCGGRSERRPSAPPGARAVEALERPLRSLGRRSAEKARLEAGAAAPPPQQSRCVGCGAPRSLNVVDPRPPVLPRMGESTSRLNHLKGQE